MHRIKSVTSWYELSIFFEDQFKTGLLLIDSTQTFGKERGLGLDLVLGIAVVLVPYPRCTQVTGKVDTIARLLPSRLRGRVARKSGRIPPLIREDTRRSTAGMTVPSRSRITLAMTSTTSSGTRRRCVAGTMWRQGPVARTVRRRKVHGRPFGPLLLAAACVPHGGRSLADQQEDFRSRSANK